MKSEIYFLLQTYAKQALLLNRINISNLNFRVSIEMILTLYGHYEKIYIFENEMKFFTVTEIKYLP